MPFLNRIQRIPVARFNRNCAIVALAFLLLTVGVRVGLDERHHADNTQDFPQYYMAALIARAGAWDSLYPIPHAGSTINPGQGWDSDLRPEARALAIANGVSTNATRFIQLPTLALFLMPLSFLPFKVAWMIWMAMLIFAAWIVSMQSARIFRICAGHRSHLEGALILLICFSPQAHRWVRVGNMSVLIGCLIGFAVIELIKRDGPRSAIALAVGSIAKYILLVLGPICIAMRRWRTILWAAAICIALVGASLVVTGVAPWKIFAHEIAPTLSRTLITPENQSLYPVLLRAIGKPTAPLPPGLEIAFHLVLWVSLIAILALIWLRQKQIRNDASHVFAGSLAMLAWALIFSPICWEHYHAYLAPFWGWLVFQATKSRLKLLGCVAAIALSWLPISLIVPRLSASLFAALVITIAMAFAGLVERE